MYNVNCVLLNLSSYFLSKKTSLKASKCEPFITKIDAIGNVPDIQKFLQK